MAALDRRGLAKFGEFLIEVGKGGFEGLAVVGVRRGGQIVHDSGAGQLQVFALLVAVNLLGRFGSWWSLLLWSLGRFDLGFYIFTFPTTCHSYSFAQIRLHLCGESQKFLQKSAA